uniref:Uncharacterized protein n=1 Tax=Anopheles atroparvus TaxID=41427 RepID=A0A182IZS0_ANOAO
MGVSEWSTAHNNFLDNPLDHRWHLPVGDSTQYVQSVPELDDPVELADEGVDEPEAEQPACSWSAGGGSGFDFFFRLLVELRSWIISKLAPSAAPLRPRFRCCCCCCCWWRPFASTSTSLRSLSIGEGGCFFRPLPLVLPSLWRDDFLRRDRAHGHVEDELIVMLKSRCKMSVSYKEANAHNAHPTAM